MPTNKYTRDFYDWKNLPFKNAIMPQLFDHVENAGDGYGGLQYMIHLLVSKYFPRHVVEGIQVTGNVNSFSISEGWVMIDGEVVHYDGASGLSLTTDQYVYIKKSGEKFLGSLDYGNYSEIDNCNGVPVCVNNGGSLKDIRSLNTSTLMQLLANLTIYKTLTVGNNLQVSGNSTLKNAQVNGDIKDKLGRIVQGLPIGTILMYVGSDWVDNTTIPGWYACIEANSSHGCPNLVDRFLRGMDPQSPPSNRYGGDLNSEHTHYVTSNVTVSRNPKYKAGMGHTHGVGTTHISNGGIHDHFYRVTTSYTGYVDSVQVPGQGTYALYTSSDSHSHPNNEFSGRIGNTGGIDGDSSYVFDPNGSLSLSNPQVQTEAGSLTEKRPPYRTFTFIRRCY